VPARGGCHRVWVINRFALFATTDLGITDHPGQPAVTLGIARQHKQVFTFRVRYPVLWCGEAETELGPEDRFDAQLACRLGETHHSVHPIVISDRDRVQAQPRRLLNQLLGMAGTVQKAEVGVAVQFGVGNARLVLGQR
jgi:hypothetical protein